MEKMKICCMFKTKDAAKANRMSITNLRVVEEYDSHCNGHRIHTSDSGERWLARCLKCGAYVLVQYSEVWSLDKDYYDYMPVRDSKHAKELNEKYDGYEIEYQYSYKKLFVNNGEPLFRDYYNKEGINGKET